MKTSHIERAALAQVAPKPRQTRAEAETQAFLADMDLVSAAINSMPRDQRMERSAAVLEHCVTPVDAEAARAAYWLRVPLPARMVAVMAARLKKERAHHGLAAFDALERGMIWMELDKLIANLSVVQKCMNGGRMPSAKGAAVH
jgi:hypothetical protein